MFEQVFLIIPILFLLAIIILLIMTYNKSKRGSKLIGRYFLEINLEIILKYFTVSSLKYYLVEDPIRDTFSNLIYKYINGNKNGDLLRNIYSHLLAKINMVLCMNFISHILRAMLD
ncbi:hypothetical protein H311_02985 [Anncaliia algerae PRA109]|nr:hypothetical protein H311_02985 [Anncaliia algerae PRA109]